MFTLSAKVTVHGSFRHEGGKLKDRFRVALDRAAIELQKMVQRTLKTQSNIYGERPSPPGSPPHMGVQQLGRSIDIEKGSDTATSMTRYVGSRLRYARIQELGGTIRSSRMMTVPVSREARRHLLSGGTARSFPRELFIWRTRSGKTAYLAEKKTRTITVHFMLTDTVTLPPRPYLRPTAESAEFREKLTRLFTDAGNLEVEVQ